jgi:DNA polymerase III epsilon subunit family exonuclease
MDRLLPVFEKVYDRFPFTGKLLVVDVETTGLERDAKLIEIGAILISFDGMEVNFDIFETLINPGCNVIPRITEITGITNEELATAPTEQEAYPKFVEWFTTHNPDKCIAHNAAFDKGKLQYNLDRLGFELASSLPEFDCTVKMSKQNLTMVKNDKLKTLSEHFNFVNNHAHRASADAEVCAYVWAKIMLGEYE